ncbi:dihydrodipicolinate synthase family protein [Erwiniaceae bacterium BAC15a-03b]|uniref:Dihydrodipicolinate synthase family protein n=1 Tax=Winslowiella arboricola TaxID=2978220 RepID=A0A9J6PEB4_9GAMM|nr:dihydrodipicolinate synthase family protein [Winslowiella arboricola]MCU5771775.1 dihydrodipicolinate synthase family protein [Winslowiella arboricola]MCU5776625.1 dihydrodipicolinate synthase family protein [Winslowiella arboricola]
MLKGNVPILATAFNQQGEVDIPSIRKLVTFLLQQGIDGLALFGNASEGYALTGAEKQAIFSAVKEMTANLPLVVAAGGASSQVAIEEIKLAERMGAQVAMVNPPAVVKPGPEEIFRFYRDICAHCDIEIMIQDAPMMTGVTIPVATLVSLCKTFPQIRYIKVEQPPTTLKISQLKQALADDIGLFGGLNAGFLYEELARGITGTMPACEFPDVINRILAAWQHDQQQAREIFYRYLPFLRYGVQPGIGVAIHKTIIHQAGLFATDRVRDPAKRIDDLTREELRQLTDCLPLAILEEGK